MIRISAVHIATASLSALLLAPTLIAQAAQPASISKVRIVRLSQVKGAVGLDRDTGRGLEPAIANLPIVENSRLQTGNGVAEVEFEDNSSLRLAPDSIVEFPALERLANGATVSSVHLVKGMAYISLMKTPGNEFSLLFGQQNLRLPAASHVRLQVDGTEARLAVLDGAVRIDDPAGAIDVSRKKTVTFAMLDSSRPAVANQVAADPLDAWDHNAVDYHARSASMSALNGSPYNYGLNDMMYYGDFANMGGCGFMWRPYFASAAWDPYANGAWAWYGNTGYSWVSPYPWGWTPYHYGAWSYCGGAGWGWMPGGSWMGLNNAGTIAATNAPGSRPIAPTHPPLRGEPTMTAVNLRPLVQSDIASSSSFVFRKDSAGLGVPRDELGKLQKFSQRTLERGTASTPIFVDAPASLGANGRPTMAAGAAESIHRGSPPSSSQAMPSEAARPSSVGGTSTISSAPSGIHSTASTSSRSH
ncbi:MAG: FecR family protein [Terracidiphilus sp.]